MKAMILAAGRGLRLSPLTDSLPKPLVPVLGKPVIEYHIESLARAGCTELVINVSYLADQLVDYLGDGCRYGVSIQYSLEAQALETGGGLKKALSLLGDEPFIAVNADILTDYPFERLPSTLSGVAHWVMIDTPDYLPGDFACVDGFLSLEKTQDQPLLTFSGIAVYSPDFIAQCSGERFGIVAPLRAAIEGGSRVSVERYTGQWFDMGSLSQLQIAERNFKI